MCIYYILYYWFSLLGGNLISAELTKHTTAQKYKNPDIYANTYLYFGISSPKITHFTVLPIEFFSSNFAVEKKQL